MQSSRDRARSRLSWIAIAGVWANAIFWAISMIERSRLLQTYSGYRYRHGGVAADWVFPTDDVATWLSAMAIEALVMSVLLRRVTGSIAGVCLVVAVLCGVGFFAMAPLAMHAAVTFTTHAVSLVFAAGWLVAMAIASALVTLVGRDRQAASRLQDQSPGSSNTPA